jgi:hypothetical protein
MPAKGKINSNTILAHTLRVEAHGNRVVDFI